MRKVWSNMMLVLPNETIEPSNVREKKKRTTVCDKSTVTCDVDIAQSEDGTAKCEKKNGTIECDKSKVKCNVGTLM